MRERKSPDLLDKTFGRVEADQEFSDRTERLSAAKRNQLTVTDFIQDDPTFRKEYRKLSYCGNELWFKKWEQTGFRRLIHANFCKIHLLCRLCALRRGGLYNKQYYVKITQVLSDYPDLIPVLITRTVKNGSSLSGRYIHISDIHKCLIQRRRLSLSSRTTSRGRITRSVMRYVRGSVGTYEFKRGRNSGLWHPHIHEIALLEPGVFEFRDEEEIYKFRDDDGEWREAVRVVSVPCEFRSLLSQEYWLCSGDSYIVDVRRIDLSDVSRPVDDDPESDRSARDSLVSALCEVFKYALKFSSLTPEDQIHAYRTLKGRRLLFSYGCMRGVEIDESLLDSADSGLEIGPYVIEMFRFVNRYSYELDRVLSGKEMEMFERNLALHVAAERRRRSLRKMDSFRGDLNIPLYDGRVITASDVEKFVAGRLGHIVTEKKCPGADGAARDERSNLAQEERW